MLHRPLMLLPLAFAIAATSCREPASMKLPPSNLKPDEDVCFFPTFGSFDQTENAWKFEVHGQVFEPENGSMKRAALIAILRAAADASVTIDDETFLDERIRPFLVDNERNKSVTIQLAGREYLGGTSEANGHFSKSLSLPLDSSEAAQNQNQVLELKAILYDRDPRSFKGRVHLIAPQGVSVISDIDDTIKHSQVTDKSVLIQNTFLREFRAVDGMANLYANLASSGVAFHYVSGSPWQLYQPLEAFMSDAGFPKGTVHLKHFRIKDSSVLELLSSQNETKLAAITPLLAAFPQRTFLLIGDSGEQDPEIYGQIAREHPEQVTAIFIRNATGETRDDDRFSNAFQGVPGDLWILFDEVAEITEKAIQCSGAKP